MFTERRKTSVENGTKADIFGHFSQLFGTRQLQNARPILNRPASRIRTGCALQPSSQPRPSSQKLCRKKILPFWLPARLFTRHSELATRHSLPIWHSDFVIRICPLHLLLRSSLAHLLHPPVPIRKKLLIDERIWEFLGYSEIAPTTFANRATYARTTCPLVVDVKFAQNRRLKPPLRCLNLRIWRGMPSFSERIGQSTIPAHYLSGQRNIFNLGSSLLMTA